MSESLKLRAIKARPVVLKLKRPVVARIATLSEWPLILIDLVTEEGGTIEEHRVNGLSVASPPAA